MVNYDYHAAGDAVRAIPDVSIRVRLPEEKERATMITPDGVHTALSVVREGTRHSVAIESVGVYSIVVFHDADLR
jgi:hypothetical protein